MKFSPLPGSLALAATFSLTALAALAALVGCNPYDPSFEGVRCSSSGQCPDTLTCVENVCQEGGTQLCGDGLIVGQEACDDGNTADGDGCNATCDVATCYVPSTHLTVADALVDAACPTIYVHSGSHVGTFVVARAVTLLGVGARAAILDGGAAGSTVTIEPAVAATLQNLTVRGGQAITGGGVLNHGTLLLQRVLVIENTALGDAPRGGGLANLGGAVTLTASQVSFNHVRTAAATAPEMHGGGIYSSGGSLRLENGSYVETNDITVDGVADAVGRGGGIYAAGTALTITAASAVIGNSLDIDGHPGRALAVGGGLYVDGGSLTVNGDSVLDGNSVTAEGVTSGSNTGANANGGGFDVRNVATVTFDNAFVRGNRVVAQGENDTNALGGGGRVSLGSVNLSTTRISGNSVSAEGLGASAGLATATAGGLALDSAGGTFTTSAISSNTVTAGTASPSAGTATAGGLLVIGTGAQVLTLLRSSLDGNIVTSNDGGGRAGGLSAERTADTLTLNLTATTVGNNLVQGGQSAEVGGVDVRVPTGTGVIVLNLVSSTISTNRADAPTGLASVGGLQAFTNLGMGRVTFNLASSTIAGNRTTGQTTQFGGLSLVKGVTQTAVVATSKNTIVAGNTGATDADCRAVGVVIASGDFNLFGTPGSCTFSGAVTGNRTGAPALLPLNDNGGPTKTHAPMVGSQIINNGNPAGCTDPINITLPTDQRGLPRVAGGRCDIGAFEVQ